MLRSIYKGLAFSAPEFNYYSRLKDEDMDNLELEYCCKVIMHALPASPTLPMTPTPTSPTTTTSSSSYV